MITSRRRARDAVYGAIAGVNGAACMSVLRVVARRLHLIETMPPQVLRESVSGRSGRDALLTPQAFDHALHLTVGLVGGGLYAVLVGRRVSAISGLAWGAAFWAASLAMLAPSLGIRRARHQARPPQGAVNLGVHLLRGCILALMVRDMGQQDAQRQWRGDRQAERVG